MTKMVGMWFYLQFKITGSNLCVLAALREIFSSSFSFACHAKETKNHHG
jgi:hypothetical protein